MMKQFASALVVTVMMAAGSAMAADTPAMDKMPMKDMMKAMPADKDGMVSMDQVMHMERARIEAKMKEKGMKSDKMTPAQWEVMLNELYRGV